MSETQNIKLYIKKSGDCYKIINNKSQSIGNNLKKIETNKKSSLKKTKAKGIK